MLAKLASVCCCCCPFESVVAALNSNNLARKMLSDEAGSEELGREGDTLMDEQEDEPAGVDPLLKLQETLGANPLDIGYETCYSNSRLSVFHKLMPPVFQHSSFIFKFNLQSSFQAVRDYYLDEQLSHNPLLQATEHYDSTFIFRFKRISSLPLITVQVDRTLRQAEHKLAVAYHSPPSFSNHSTVHLAGVIVDRGQPVRVQCLVEAKLNCSLGCSALKQPCIKQIQQYVEKVTENLQTVHDVQQL